VQPGSFFGVLQRRTKWIEDPLPQSEWDFRCLIHRHATELERHELRAAVFYEYARESPTIRNIARKFAKLPRKMRTEFEVFRWSNNPRITSELFFFSGLPFSHCILGSKFFPDTPWLEIPKSERNAAVERYIEKTRAILFEITAYGDVKHWEVSDQYSRRFKTSSGIEHVLIAINWTAGVNDQIIRAFGDWVRHNRPKQFPPPRNDASRRNITAAFLTRLANMRLLHNCSHSDAFDLAQHHHLKLPKQQSNALRRRVQVRKDISLLFQSRAFEANTGPAE
jgi:hypothetical protein